MFFGPAIEWGLDQLGGVVDTAVGVVMGWLGSAVAAVAAVAEHIVDQLPDATDLGLEIPSGWIYGYSIANTFLPLAEALTFVGVFAALIVGSIVFRLAIIVYHLIPKPMMGT